MKIKSLSSCASYLSFLIYSILFVVLDQSAKGLMLKKLNTEILPMKLFSFLDLVIVWNHGVAFGVFNSFPIFGFLLAILCNFITALIPVFIISCDGLMFCCAASLIFGGGMSNLVDRYVYGAVFDFIDFHVLGWHWPAFNIADCMVTSGVVIIILVHLLDDRA